MIDQRYSIIEGRLSQLSKQELLNIIENIDDVCLDEFNYDAENKKYCPLAMAMRLDRLPDPSDDLIKSEIGKRFFPVNVIKGVPGRFYTDNRKENLIKLCESLLTKL